MTPERWRQAKEILDTILVRPDDDQRAYLDEVLGDQPDLMREVESLLEFSDEDPSGFIERPIFNIHDEDPDLGRLIGPYRVVRLLGRGGMGAVYLAEREDFEKQVAIKLIKPGLNREEIVRRFHNERQVLAKLEHPNIARLLDGGTTDEGAPYFVMEYVEGEPIDQYCESRNLPIRERLKLFRQVCSAVYLSHQALVVHRDLKPGNILVSTEGVPKLLDFGIAKLLQPGLAARPLTTENPPMTFEYASPEQVRGERITTASDTFALGLVLFRLLTGQSPFNAPQRLGVAWAICDQEPPKPSDAVVSEGQGVDQDRRRRQLVGDLDSIVLKSLRKEPQHRYASVQQFSEDLRRHLDGLPVIARADTFAYRAGKFIRRKRLGLALSAAIVVLAVSSVVLIHAQNRRILLERDRAENIVESLEEIFGASDSRESKGQWEILESSLANDRGLEAPLHARLTSLVAHVFITLGSQDAARSLLEETLKIRQTLTEDPLPVAETQLNLARLLVLTGDLDAANLLIELALANQRQGYPKDHAELAKGIGISAVYHLARGDSDKAELLYREALAMKVRLFGDDAKEVATTLSSLGTLALGRDELEEAESLHQRALAIRRDHFPDSHPKVLLSLSQMARLYVKQGRKSEAESFYREVLKLRRETLPADDPRVVKSLYNLGACLDRMERDEEAMEVYKEALAIQLGNDYTRRALNRMIKLYQARGEQDRADLYRALVQAE